MTAKQYASFILQTGLEIGQTIYYISPCYPFLYKKEDYASIPNYSTHITPELLTVASQPVNYTNIFDIIEGWNVEYFWRKEDAEKAIKEYKNIIAIEDENLRCEEYDNWIAERRSFYE